MKAFKKVVPAFLAVFLASTCFASWTAIRPSEFEMSAPPKSGSRAYERDFRELHRLQDSRTDSECDLAASQFAPTFEAFYGGPSGILSEEEYARAEPLLEQVFKVSGRISNYFKDRYHRPRPYDVDETITPCVQKPGGSKAYPSSHAALATVSACVLSKIYPSKAKKLRDYGTYLGQLRVIVGVHHPSDVEAGQTLGTEICDRLLSDDEFKSEMP